MRAVRWLVARAPAHVRVWLQVLRRLRGASAADAGRLALCAVWGMLTGWRRGVLVTPVVGVTVRDARSPAHFTCRRGLDDLYHVLPGREGDVEAAILHALRPGDVMVDVGANVGAYTVRAARTIGDEGRVHAIEPVPATAAMLRHNLVLNGLDNVVVDELAVDDGSSAGRGTVVVAPARSGTASLLGGGQTGLDVTTTTLDELLHDVADIAVMKLDIEGGELAALRGASFVLQRTSRVVLETNRDTGDITLLLERAGFLVRRMTPEGHLVADRS